MRVREATAEDWPRVRELLIELGRPEVRADDDEHRERFAAYLAREDATAFVAEDDGGVVGFIDLEFRQRLHFSSPQAWVPDLIVSEASRSRGAGAALLARADACARERGCWGITLESASWRTRAHAFYQREGLAHLGASFAKTYDGTTWPPPPR